MQFERVMEDQFSIGKIVWAFRLGSEGEIVKKVDMEEQIKYHVHVPSEDETYCFGADDLYLFPPTGQENIRREWARAAS